MKETMMMRLMLAVVFCLTALLPEAAPAETADPGRDTEFPMKESSEHIGNSYNSKSVVTWHIKKQPFKSGAAPLTGELRMVNRGDKPLKIDLMGRFIQIRLYVQDGTSVQSANEA